MFLARLLVLILILLPFNGFTQSSEFQLRTEMFNDYLKNNNENPIFRAAWTSQQEKFFVALWNQDVQNEITEALKKGLDINERDSRGRTAIMHAIAAPNADLFGFLVKMGARLDLKDHEGNDIADIAKKSGADVIGYFRNFKSLIKYAYHGVDISPLILELVTKNKAQELKAWLDKGVSPDYNPQNHRSILTIAISFKSTDVVNLLIERGATIDPNLACTILFR